MKSILVRCIWLAAWAISLLPAQASRAAEYYVAQKNTGAADTNPGTEDKPFKTIKKACEAAQAGDTVYIKEGIYREPLQPCNSGQEGKPIVFTGRKEDVVMIKGSEEVTGFERDGDVWVKRPWTRTCWWVDDFKKVSSAPYEASARIEQVFVNDEPLQWVPSRADLKEGCFYWHGEKGGGELAVHPPPGVEDLNKVLVETPVLEQVVCAWQGDPRGWQEVRRLRKEKPDDPNAKKAFPEVHYIHIKNLHFRHAAHTLNRTGVRLDGDHWLLENCVVEYMNAVGIATAGDHDVVRNCTANYNGQSGLGGAGLSVFENCTTMFNNRKLFSISWGGAGNKICVVDDCVVRGLVSCFNYGSGLWFDIDCQKVVVEDGLALGNCPVNAGFFYEISWDGAFRRNVSFANHGVPDGGFYSAGVLLSCSAKTTVEENVVIGGGGGLGVGGGREREKGGDPSQYYRSVGNRFRNNLVVEPHSFSISIRKMAQHDSTALEADNRFLNNTFLIMAGAPKVVFGDRSFDNPKLFEKGYKNATGNVFVTSLRMLRASDRDRIHEALKKVLNSLRLVKGGPSIAVDKVKLKDIWALGSKTTAMGYWVEGDDKNYLLLDLAAPDTFRLSASAKTAEVWDFPVLKGAVKKPFEKKGNLLTGSVDGPFALVTGLDDGTRPIRLRVKTGETRPGK